MANTGARASRDFSTDPSRGRYGKVGRAVIETKRAYWSVVGGPIDFSPQPLGRQIDPSGLAGYYCDLRGKTGYSVDEMLANGYDWAIPMAQAALGYWERHLEGEDTAEEFMRIADWLVDEAEVGAGGLVWRADMPVAKYGLTPGWVSAMSQGQAMSVLLRAHRLGGEDRYLETALGALAPMTVATAAGGVQATEQGLVVLEEYPTPTPSAVLNGWIFALFGLHELVNVSGEPAARSLFEESCAGLCQLLPRYDAGWWSLYSLYDHGSPDLAKPFYQRLHPVLLEGLALASPDPRLDFYARRWRAQDTRLNVGRVTLNKIVFRFSRVLRERRVGRVGREGRGEDDPGGQ